MMKVLSKKREGNRISLEIEESYDRYLETFEKTMLEMGKELKLPGFRPGKAPRDLLERSINREAVEHRAAQDLIGELYPEILKEGKIDPVDYPNIEIVEFEKDKPLIFKLSIDVYPEVKLGDYQKLTAKKKVAEVSEEEIIQVLGRLQERFTYTTPEGQQEKIPLDDDFAKKVSSYGTLAELKEEVRQAVVRDKAAEAEADLKNQIVNSLTQVAEVDIPPAMVDREVDVMIDELQSTLARGGLTVDDYLKGASKGKPELRAEMRNTAEARVKGKIILRAIAEKEKIEITKEGIDEEIKAMAESAGQEIADIEKNIGLEGENFIRDYLLRRKALDLVIEQAKIEEVKG